MRAANGFEKDPGTLSALFTLSLSFSAHIIEECLMNEVEYFAHLTVKLGMLAEKW